MSDVKDKTVLTVTSLNVDGFGDASVWKWIETYLADERPHILCLSETKKNDADLGKMFEPVKNEYRWLTSVHQPRNMHGVAMLIRNDVKCVPVPIDFGKCRPRSDNQCQDKDAAFKGRVISICVDDSFYLVLTYVPNAGSDPKKPLKHLGYRLEQWNPALSSYLASLAAKKPTVWLGDLNVAPTEMDVTDAKKMERWAGFTEEERRDLHAMLDKVRIHPYRGVTCCAVTKGEWIDVWRKQHPKERAYSWRGHVNSEGLQNKMRLDHVVVSKTMLPLVADAFLFPSDSFHATTDHVPIGIRVAMPCSK